MPAIINPTITDAGLAAAVSADAGGIQVQITHVALGAGAYAPTGSETTMVDRREKVSIGDGGVTAGGVLHVSVLFPSLSTAPYTASEIGFYIGDPDAGGTLFAVFSTTAVDGIVLRTSLDFVAQFSLGLTRVPAGSVTVNIDPAAAFLHAMLQAHREEEDAHPDMMAAHTSAADPHEQYLRKLHISGAVMHFARATPPAGWLKANGATVSRALYPDLFAAIGTVFGAGDGATTFGLPDLRGEFIRSLDEARGVDPDRTLGSQQKGTLTAWDLGDDAVFGLTAASGVNGPASAVSVGADGYQTADYPGLKINGATEGSWQPLPGGTGGSSSTGGYTGVARPRNVALLACIKT